MEKIIEALKEANNKLAEANQTIDAILEDMGRIQTLPWGSEQDEKNITNED